MALAVGTRFGPYEIVEQIGSGGMGEVWRARDTRLKREVAVKALPESFAADVNRLSRFQREAEVLASLNHPNIATIHGLEEADGQTVIVMELVEGPTLADRIAEGPIPPDEALGIARQIADALEAAHERQIVHRDLKPANIKLKDDGTVKVLDFGISKPLDASAISGGSPVMTTPAVTQTGVILGTAAYMSPEQARGKFVDERTDIWAFGCLLFEMLTGQPAFGGDDVMAILARVIDRDTDLSSVPGTISPAVRHTIKLCLEKDPRRRIHHIGDVRLALDGRFEPEPGTAAPARATNKRPLWPLVATALVAALVAAGGSFVVSSALEERPEPQIRQFVETLSADRRLNNPSLPMLAVSPDGSGFVFSAGGGLYLRRFDELEPRLIPGTEGERPVTPVISPDGGSVVYESGPDGALKVIPITGGQPLPIVPDVPNSGWRWPRDDMILFGSNAVCEISAVTPAGGTPKLIAEDPGFGCYEPTLLPDGQRLLYERRDLNNTAEPEVAVMSVETGESVGLFPGKQPHYFEPGYLVYFDIRLGLMGRTFDSETLEFGDPVIMTDEVNMSSPTAGVQLALSSGGTLVYLRGGRAALGGRQLGIADESGSIDFLETPLMNYSYPSVSPDGSRVAAQADDQGLTQIFVYQLDGDAEIRQLTYEGRNFHPAWSPNGEMIAYASERDGQSRIYQRRADGTGVPEPLTEPQESYTYDYPVWAPDGRLVYREVNGDGASFKIVSLPDGPAETLISADYAPLSVDFSADGKAMAYTATRGRFEILVEPFPPDGSRGARISPAGQIQAAWPVWSRSGSRVRFQTSVGTYAAVDVDTANFSTRNRAVIQISNVPQDRLHDSMPGSNQMLVATLPGVSSSGQSDAETLVIIENWIEELKRRVPTD